MADEWGGAPVEQHSSDEFGGVPAGGASEGVGTSLARTVTDIPHEIYQAGAAGLHEMNAANPWGAERTEAQKRGEPPSMSTLPRAAMGAVQLGLSVPTGITHAVGGHLLDLLNRGMRAGAVKLYGEDKVRQAEEATGTTNGYEAAKGDVDKLMMGLGPKGSPVQVPALTGAAEAQRLAAQPYPGRFEMAANKPNFAWDTGTKALPVPPRTGPLGVTLSEGQETAALPAIQQEQSALAGRLGPTAMERAKQFETQQQGQVGAAQEGIRQSLDPFGQVVADSPQEAGQLVSQGVQQAAAARKADVDAAYTHARSLPGEVQADAFKDIGARIKSDLSNRPEPIVIDDSLTPFASKAIQDVDSRIGQLQIQNRASATGQPPQNTIMGVTLNGVDQMRKRLVAMRQQAFGTGNATDGRAVKAVIDAFDDHIDNAINHGLFTGDQRAVQAWNNARAAHADYSKTFKAGTGDPIGRVVEKIVGKYTNDPMIPNKVADQLYGAQGTSASDINVGVANRVKKILGDRSPEWSAVKQGLFSRLTETAEGVTDWGSQKVSNNLNNFLNGKGRELAEAIFNPQERQLLQQYADLHKQLVVPPKGMNPSQTSTFIAPLLRRIGSKIGMVVGAGAGAALGHSSGIPLGIEAGAAAGAGMAKAIDAVANAREAAQISRQMPLVAQSAQRYQKALAAAQKANSPISQRAMAVATANLARTLQPFGIDLRKLNTVQGPAPASADENQRQRGGRANAEPDQGEQRKAHGGHFRRGGVVRKGPSIIGRADGGGVPADPVQGDLMSAARQQYPILNDYDIGYKYSENRAPFMLESWAPGMQTSIPGVDRPQEFAPDKFGVEVYDPKTRPIDILGDVVSHHMVNVDPVIKQIYGDFKGSIEPWQENHLRRQFAYAKAHEHGDETNSYERWKDEAGLPSYFRGYPFQQWENSEDMYTAAQIKQLNGMMDYLRAPRHASGGRVGSKKLTNKAHGFAHGGRVEPANINHAPTEGQKEAGNYAKDHVNIHGLDVTVENAKGAERGGIGRDGKPWSVKMPAHYGYIKGTVGKDKDHVDVYLGPHIKSPHVFVIDQMDADSKKFDEHKAFIGFASKAQVIATYRKAFSDGRAQERLGHLAAMDIGQFSHWLDKGNTTKPVADHAAKKLSHKAVGYIAKSRVPGKHCSLCAMYRPGPHCSLVRDPILPGGLCRRFALNKD